MFVNLVPFNLPLTGVNTDWVLDRHVNIMLYYTREGTPEVTQDITENRKIEGEKTLLDNRKGEFGLQLG